MIHEHVLGGCTPTPLAHYLKALGILRLVAEQKDPQVTGRWEGEQFVLRTVLTWSELVRFFLEEYRPTPIVAPWNGGSGFYCQEEKLKDKDPLTGKRFKTGVRNQPTEATKTVDRLLASKTDRLKTYRLVLSTSKSIIQVFGFSEAPKDEEKYGFIAAIRGAFPDEALHWIDAAVLLGSDQPDFPPLLGTGGNDGNLDFTNNFMQRLVEIFNPDDGKPQPKSSAWLIGALSGGVTFGLVSKAIGQFSPGNAGGPNATTGFDSGSMINPWDFLLMLEGALLFAGAATRRMEGANKTALSYPFTVRITNAGSGNVAVETKPRDEIWLPLWPASVTLAELRTLLAEGRVTVGRRAARDGLDFARAVSGFGVDRGISDFQRYAFLMRSGKAYLATPLARIQVSRNPKTDLITYLDRNRWLERMRRFGRDKNTPGRIQGLVRRLEDGIFALTQNGNSSALNRTVIQNILTLLGQIQQACVSSAKARDVEKGIMPVPILSAEWAMEADDSTHEFRLACALAGLADMRSYLLPLKDNIGKIEWNAGSSKAVWGGGNLVGNLLRVLDRRLLEAQRNGEEEKPLAGLPAADLAAVMAFVLGETDDGRIADLLAGLVNVKLPQHFPKRDMTPDQPPAAFGLMKPLFTPDAILQKLGLLSPDGHLPLPREVVTLLKTGNHEQVNRAIAVAWRRLRIAGLKLPAHPRQPPELVGTDSTRLAAALMIPLATGDLARICQPFMPVQEAD